MLVFGKCKKNGILWENVEKLWVYIASILENYEIFNQLWIKFVEILHKSLLELIVKNLREILKTILLNPSGYLIKLWVKLNQIFE